MKLKIKSNNKKVALDQAFIFNGVRIHITLLDGEGFADVYGENVDREYLERAILAPLNIEVVNTVDHPVELVEKAKVSEEAEVPTPAPETEEPEEEKVEEKVGEEISTKEEAATKKSTKSTSKKKTTRRRKKTTTSKK